MSAGSSSEGETTSWWRDAAGAPFTAPQRLHAGLALGGESLFRRTMAMMRRAPVPRMKWGKRALAPSWFGTLARPSLACEVVCSVIARVRLER